MKFGKLSNMNKIGKQPIEIPQGVTVTVDGSSVTVKGSKGELSRIFDPIVVISVEDNKAIVKVKSEEKAAAIWGLSRVLLANMVVGVSEGFTKKLEFTGVGYKAVVNGDTLELALGFSHPIKYKAPEGIKFEADKTSITVIGIDKQLVGQVAAEIRSFRKPEPYKGKGIRYEGEHIRRKAGKKVAAAA